MMKLKPGKTVVMFTKDFAEWNICVGDLGVFKKDNGWVELPYMIDVGCTYWFF